MLSYISWDYEFQVSWIALGIRTREDDNGLEEEENFEEALKAANTALEHTRIPTDVTAILADPKCSNLVKQNSWLSSTNYILAFKRHSVRNTYQRN